MRAFLATLLMLAVNPAVHGAERITFDLEWGFAPAESELYWDGTFQVTGGKLVSSEPVSFESDRHDRLLSRAAFRSLTVGNGTDGLKLVIQGDGKTEVQLDSKEGKFRWTVAQLQKKGEYAHIKVRAVKAAPARKRAAKKKVVRRKRSR